MFTEEEFEKWAQDTWTILLDIRIAEANLDRLYTDDDALEKEVKNLRFFDHYKHQQLFVIVIQLSKLISNSTNQKGNFHKLIRKLKTNISPELKEKITSNNDISDPSIEEFNKILTNIENEFLQNKILIDRLTDLRDKQYAHKDNVSVTNMTFQEYKDLIHFVDGIFKAITLRVTGKTWHAGYTVPWDIDPILMFLKRGFDQHI